MSFLLMIAGSVLSVGGILILVFTTRNLKIQLRFERKAQRLRYEIRSHEIQIRMRAERLDRYDFLKYNLHEAIISQNATAM